MYKLNQKKRRQKKREFVTDAFKHTACTMHYPHFDIDLYIEIKSWRSFCILLQMVLIGGNGITDFLAIH